MPTGLLPWRHLDLNLRSCGLHGHATYAPDEPQLAARLRADTALGEAWRCLRCGAFVAGAPHGRGPADEAPLVLRGAALKDALVLRLLALEKGVRGALIVLLAFGIWRFDGSRLALQQVFDSYLPLLTPIFQRLGIDLASTGPVHRVGLRGEPSDPGAGRGRSAGIWRASARRVDGTVADAPVG